MSKVSFAARSAEAAVGPALVLEIAIGSDGLCTPEEFAAAVRGLALAAPEPGAGLVLSGRAPVWGFAMLAHWGHPFAWVATHDPRLGSVVVQTHRPGLALGAVFPFPTP